MKIVYIAHPIWGDVTGNLIDIQGIIREINLDEPEIVPTAPYFADCIAMDDNNQDERRRGMENSLELLKRGLFDEIWLYGNHISCGMRGEIKAAINAGIKVVPMSNEIIKEYIEMGDPNKIY